MLWGRDREKGHIQRLLSAAADGTSGVLTIRGEPGIGKTALLDHAVTAAGHTMRVLRGTGAESEAELPFAGLHLLLNPVLDRVGTLPGPQADALLGAFGMAASGGGDRFLVGLAVLSLLSDLAEDGPLLCVVDDAHWLDRSSSEALLFAARRLGAEGVALLFAARDGGFDAPGLPVLRLAGLDVQSSRAILDEHAEKLSAENRYRILATAQGNPLALRELPRMLVSGSFPLTDRMERGFLEQIQRFPAATQTALLVAAIDDTGDLGVVLRAADLLGASLADFEPAESAGLVYVCGTGVAFRHPLVRAAVYPAFPMSRRMAVHAALAEVMDTGENADRRAWHLAAAVTDTDEEAARQLELTAVRAGERSGHAAAAAAYERAAGLTPEGPDRARRFTLAAEAASESGDLEHAGGLAARTVAPESDVALHARLIHVRANADFSAGRLREATLLLLEGADLVEASNPLRALRLLTEAVHTCWYACDRDLTSALSDRLDRLPADEPLRDLLRWTVGQATGHRASDLPPLPQVAVAARAAEWATPRDLMMVCACSVVTGQDDLTRELATTLIAEGRAQGRIGWLPPALTYLAQSQLLHGLHHDARASAEEALRIADATGQRQWITPTVLAYIAAVEGDEERCRALADDTLPISRGKPWIQWALGLLDLGQGRADAALTRLEALAQSPAYYHLATTRSTPDLVEAAVRSGEPDRAATPLAGFAEWATHARQPGIDALVLRCRALLAPDTEADRHYLAALERHAEADRPFEHARTRLLYGELLRRARRKSDARIPLAEALATFERLGAVPWAERARTELAATGTPAPRGADPDPLRRLTPQELQIVRLAAQGLSNREIAAQLFLSPRTVGHHLYKAYPKLGIASRGDLDPAVLA